MKDFFKSKGAGFYVSASAAVLSLITLIVYALYATVGEGQQYFSTASIILLAVSVAVFAAACIFRQTAPWAPFLQAVFVFTAFLVFVYACYRYFTEVFYGGINSTAFEIMNKWFLASIILFFVSTVLSQVGLHMRQTKTRKENAQ